MRFSKSILCPQKQTDCHVRTRTNTDAGSWVLYENKERNEWFLRAKGAWESRKVKKGVKGFCPLIDTTTPRGIKSIPMTNTTHQERNKKSVRKSDGVYKEVVVKDKQPQRKRINVKKLTKTDWKLGKEKIDG